MDRSFFALWPDAAVRERLAAHAEDIAFAAGGRALKSDTFHLTLVFMGNVPDTDLNRLAATVDRISRKPFNIGLDRLACHERSKVAWIGTSHAPQALLDMQVQLQYEVESAGFSVDQRRFQPHLSIARNIDQDFDARAIDVILWSVRTMCLVHSDTKPEGASYKIVKTWKL